MDPHKLLFIPKGCAHGFLTTADNTGVVYYVDNFYSPRHEKVIKYNDERFNIKWPTSIRKVSKNYKMSYGQNLTIKLLPSSRRGGITRQDCRGVRFGQRNQGSW